MLSFLVSWILIVLGLAVGLYEAIQLLIGVVAAVRVQSRLRASVWRPAARLHSSREP
jgi:hypothetical protein